MVPPRASPCDACDSRCCRTYSVHLTLDDAGRIASGLDQPMLAFAAYLPQPARTASGFLLAPGGPTHDLVLGVKPPPEPRAGCLFLGAAGRCSIYRLRPRACRRFPAFIEGGRVAARGGIVCGEGAWGEATMARRSWRAELEREAREIALHEAVVGVWNERVEGGADGAPRTAADFLDHLSDAWAWLVRARAALRPGERTGPAFLGRVRETLRGLPAGPAPGRGPAAPR